MRAILQRVIHAKVDVNGKTVAEIGPGLLIFIGIGQGDTPAVADALAEKCSLLRMFDDSAGKTNFSILDTQGQALVVSQFTLYADTRRGRRPSFTEAAPPDIAEDLCARFVEKLSGCGVQVKTGMFRAHMVVELVNDGPFTISLEEPEP